jgi:hypothetical protein
VSQLRGMAKKWTKTSLDEIWPILEETPVDSSIANNAQYLELNIDLDLGSEMPEKSPSSKPMLPSQQYSDDNSIPWGVLSSRFRDDDLMRIGVDMLDVIEQMKGIETERPLKRTVAPSLHSSNCTSYRLFKNTKRAKLSTTGSLDWNDNASTVPSLFSHRYDMTIYEQDYSVMDPRELISELLEVHLNMGKVLPLTRLEVNRVWEYDPKTFYSGIVQEYFIVYSPSVHASYRIWCRRDEITPEGIWYGRWTWIYLYPIFEGTDGQHITSLLDWLCNWAHQRANLEAENGGMREWEVKSEVGSELTVDYLEWMKSNLKIVTITETSDLYLQASITKMFSWV